MKRKGIDFEEITVKLEVSHRGGYIEISLDTFGKKYEGYRMIAYQNYLGGGLLGKVCSDCNYPKWNKRLSKIAEQLREYYFNLTNPPEDTWEHQTFEINQTSFPVSAY